MLAILRFFDIFAPFPLEHGAKFSNPFPPLHFALCVTSFFVAFFFVASFFVALLRIYNRESSRTELQDLSELQKQIANCTNKKAALPDRSLSSSFPHYCLLVQPAHKVFGWVLLD